MHIDAAYAGSAFICPEFRPLLDGVEVSNSTTKTFTPCTKKSHNNRDNQCFSVERLVQSSDSSEKNRP